MSGHYFGALQKAVVDASRSTSWMGAVGEWEVTGLEEHPQAAGICVCGKTGLLCLYTIHNPVTGETLFPIGSVCVNLFGVDELDADVDVLKRLFQIRTAILAGKTLELTTEYFSRAVLADLWENGAFPPNDYNRRNGDNDYKFLLDMFNQRHELTVPEEKKVWVLVNRTIPSFLMGDQRLK